MMRYFFITGLLCVLHTSTLYSQNKVTIGCNDSNLIDRPSTTTWSLSLNNFIKQAIADKPTVTGGCVTTISAVNGLALAMMAFEISASKQKDSVRKAMLAQTLTILNQKLYLLACHAEKDNDVFKEFMRLSKLSSASPQQKKIKDSALTLALLHATELPIEAAETIIICLQIIANNESLCNRALYSDFGAGSLLLKASADGLLLMARTNLQSVEEPSRTRLLNQCKEIDSKAKTLLAQILAFITS